MIVGFLWLTLLLVSVGNVFSAGSTKFGGSDGAAAASINSMQNNNLRTEGNTVYTTGYYQSAVYINGTCEDGAPTIGNYIKLHKCFPFGPTANGFLYSKITSFASSPPNGYHATQGYYTDSACMMPISNSGFPPSFDSPPSCYNSGQNLDIYAPSMPTPYPQGFEFHGPSFTYFTTRADCLENNLNKVISTAYFPRHQCGWMNDAVYSDTNYHSCSDKMIRATKYSTADYSCSGTPSEWVMKRDEACIERTKFGAFWTNYVCY